MVIAMPESAYVREKGVSRVRYSSWISGS